MEVVDGGSGPRASGGGGAGGRYVFASVEELDGLIGEWEALRDRITRRGNMLQRAIDLIEPPAHDIMSKFQADAAINSLKKAEQHRRAMEDYADGYVRKLKAALAEYVATDGDGASAVGRAGEGLSR